jgi:hypothetical protein
MVPFQSLCRADAAAVAAGHDSGSATARSLDRGVGLPLPPRSRGCGGAAMTILLATTPFSIDGSFGGGVPSSSVFMEGFPIPPASSSPLFDAAGGDPSSPSW